MTSERYREIWDSGRLTKEEVDLGYRFCDECDGLLYNINDGWTCCKLRDGLIKPGDIPDDGIDINF